MVRRLLTDAGRRDLLEPASLLVSEVVTNALVHSGTTIDVSMALRDGGVLVEVGDGSQHMPVRRHYAPTASTGRGLALLDKTATAWGVVPGVRGKTVWFQVDSNAIVDHSALDPGPSSPTVVPLRPGDEALTVILLDVPLLLHAAWQQHADAILREYLLVSLAGVSRDDAFALHAAATDALAVLQEQIPEPAFEVEPDLLLSTAVEPAVSAARVDVRVPLVSVPHFPLLNQTLDAAQTMAERGELLVPMVQPELRMMRRWLCDEVEWQGGGADPSPWPPPHWREPPTPRNLRWDARGVSESTEAMIAADDLDMIVAASQGALDMLGYAREDLVGRRLITLIPQRFRQAHLAGFTLHLLTGRGPLLGRPVVVPAIHRDGSEMWVQLRVEARRVTQGRSLFVATLRQPPD
ncbi:MAG: PAS domain S-box protein [Nocardioidaceae bacterium]